MRTCTIERLPIEKGVIRNFPKFIQKHLCQSPFFNTLGGSVLQKYKGYKNTYSYITPLVAASAYWGKIFKIDLYNILAQ